METRALTFNSDNIKRFHKLINRGDLEIIKRSTCDFTPEEEGHFLLLAIVRRYFYIFDELKINKKFNVTKLTTWLMGDIAFNSDITGQSLNSLSAIPTLLKAVKRKDYRCATFLVNLMNEFSIVLPSGTLHALVLADYKYNYGYSRVSIIPALASVNDFSFVTDPEQKRFFALCAYHDGNIKAYLAFATIESFQKSSTWSSFFEIALKHNQTESLHWLFDRIPASSLPSLRYVKNNPEFNQFLTGRIVKYLNDNDWRLHQMEIQAFFELISMDTKIDIVNMALLMTDATEKMDCLFLSTDSNRNDRLQAFSSSLYDRFIKFYEHNDPQLETFLTNYSQTEYCKSLRFANMNVGGYVGGPGTNFLRAIEFATLMLRIKNNLTVSTDDILEAIQKNVSFMGADIKKAIDFILPGILKLDDPSLYNALVNNGLKHIQYDTSSHFFLIVEAGAEKIFELFCQQNKAFISRHIIGEHLPRLSQINAGFADHLISTFHSPVRANASTNPAKFFKLRDSDGKLLKLMCIGEASGESDDETLRPPSPH